MPESVPELYEEFERAYRGRTHKEVAKAVDEFASRYEREALVAVYNAGWAKVMELSGSAPGAYSVRSVIGSISRLSYGLGVLSRHIHPLPDAPQTRRERNIVM